MKYLIAEWAWDTGMKLLVYAQKVHGQKIRFMVMASTPVEGGKLKTTKVPCE